MHFGDPTFAGWLIVFVYFLVVSRCYFKHAEAKKQGVDAYFWVSVGGFLLLLGLNKQLDMQTVFEVSMRDLVKLHGWYAQRQLMQIAFIVFLALGLLTMLVILRKFLAKAWENNKVVCFGLFLICVFILLRAAAFNHFSFLNTRSYLGFNAHALLELGALITICYGTNVSKKPLPPQTNVQLTAEDGDGMHCPKCGVQPLSELVDGRIFKCRSCSYKYRVIVQNS